VFASHAVTKVVRLRHLFELRGADIGHHRCAHRHMISAPSLFDGPPDKGVSRLLPSAAPVGTTARRALFLHRGLRRHPIEAHADRNFSGRRALRSGSRRRIRRGRRACRPASRNRRPRHRLWATSPGTVQPPSAQTCPFSPLCGVGAFDDRRELGIADARHIARRADGTRADADFGQMSAPARIRASVMSPVTTLPAMMIDFGFSSRARLTVSRNFFGIAVGDVEAQQAHGRALLDLRELGEIGLGRADRIEGVRAVGALEEFGERSRRDNACAAPSTAPKRPSARAIGSVPVTSILAAISGKPVQSAPVCRKRKVLATSTSLREIERRALGTDQHVLEIQFLRRFSIRMGEVRKACKSARPRYLAQTSP